MPVQLSIPANTLLFHGTPALRFTHGHLAPAGPNPPFPHPPTPTPPAWFATNILFSLHAGVRGFAPGVSGQMMIYQYRVRPQAQIDLMRFYDVADLSAFLVNQEAVYPARPPLTSNNMGAALRWSYLAQGLDGYQLDRDPVRGQPEIVLFQSGLAKLQGESDIVNVNAQPNVVLAGGAVIPHHAVTTTLMGHRLGDYYHTGGPGLFI